MCCALAVDMFLEGSEESREADRIGRDLLNFLTDSVVICTPPLSLSAGTIGEERVCVECGRMGLGGKRRGEAK